MQIEYAAMDMRNEIRSPEEVYKELEALWVKQGRRTVSTKAARPVHGPKPRPQTRPVTFAAIQLDLKRKELALLSLS